MKNTILNSLTVVTLLSFGAVEHCIGQIYTNVIFPEDQQTDTLSTSTVEAFDINGDGHNDLIIGNEYQRNAIMYGDGMGNFVLPETPSFSLQGNDTEDMVIGDFNRDSLMDVIFINRGGFNGHEYYLNNGDGTFSDGMLNIAPSAGSSIAMTDLNGDGNLDLIIGNDGEPNICLIGDSTGVFTDETALRLPDNIADDQTNDVVFGDVDGDGDLDLFVANRGRNRLLFNNGLGIFTDQTSGHLPLDIDTDTETVAFGDVDGDGDLDIFLGNVQFENGADYQNRMYINDGTAVFFDETDMFLPIYANQTTNSMFYDINNDGQQEILMSNVLSEGLQFYFNRLDDNAFYEQLTDSIVDSPIGAAYEIWDFAIANLDGDTIPDIFIPNRTGHHFIYKGIEGDIVSGVKQTPEIASFSTYPNPVSGLDINIEIALNQTAVANLFDFQGLKIGELSIENIGGEKSKVLLPQSIQNGWYILSINDGDKQYNTKIIVGR